MLFRGFSIIFLAALTSSCSLSLISSRINGTLTSGASASSAVAIAIGAATPTAINSVGSVVYPVTYTNAASVNLTNAHITMNPTGTASCSSAVVSNGTTSTPSVTLSGCSGDGNVTISILAGSATDASAVSAGSQGPSAAITIDNTAPSLSIGTPSNATVSSSGTSAFTVNYTGASAVGLLNANVTMNTTGTASCSRLVTNGSTATPTVTLSSCTGDGTVTISIAAATATDAVGNNAPAAGPSTAITVDNTAPLISIGTPSNASINGTGTSAYTITYTGASVVNLVNANITVNTTGTATCSANVTNGTTRRL
ncbi:hypothetical protein K2X30_11130 [bacterium]|nr:hypothetical protein [bacterium]